MSTINIDDYLAPYFANVTADSATGYRGTAILDSKIRAKYEAIFAKAGVPLDQVTPLQMHTVYFVDPSTGYLTTHSLRDRLGDLGIGWFRKNLFAFLIARLVSNATGETAHTISLQKIHIGTYNSDTNIFDAKGNFSLTDFYRLASFAREGMFSYHNLREMLKAISKKDEQNGIKGAFVDSFFLKGGFDLALELFADAKTKEGNPAITLFTLAKVHLCGPQFFEKLAEKHRSEAAITHRNYAVLAPV